MLETNHIYVLDTSVLIDYVDIIPTIGKDYRPPACPTVDLSEAHIVVPIAVINELDKFKEEKTSRGKAAREASRRIRLLVENGTHSMDDLYGLDDSTSIHIGKQIFSVLPVHKHFCRTLPFAPSSHDGDGQIILATLAVMILAEGFIPDGTTSIRHVMGLESSRVTLLTNDNNLAIRARECGLDTSRYGYIYPEPYTGRREVEVAPEILAKFKSERMLELQHFEEYLSLHDMFKANEFIVFSSQTPDTLEDYHGLTIFDFDHIGRYDAEAGVIVALSYASRFPLPPRNVGQAIYAEALMNPAIAAVICTGPAGSGKTFMGTVYGYHACKNGEYIGITVVPCENRSNIGALPGNLAEKMDPDIQPIKNSIRNYLLLEDNNLRKSLSTLRKFGAVDKSPDRHPAGDAGKKSLKARLEDQVNLIWDNWFSSIPIDNARGRDFSYELAFYDEFQDQTITQADTLIKRLGKDGKIIITGDTMQIHSPYLDHFNNGLVYASSLLLDHPMVAQVHFTEDEVIRHPLVKAVTRRQKQALHEPPTI